jgi:hypothetical protein
MSDTTQNHLSLWDSVSQTDELFTKLFTRGEFVGTSINPTYLVKRATEMFGVMGQGWGVRVLEEKYVDGAPLLVVDGNPTLYAKIHTLRAELWYTHGGKNGSVEQFGQTTFVGARNDGTFFTDEDAPKKSLTDVMTKCLSLLGFSSDIYLGTFDDKYSTGQSHAKSKAPQSESGKLAQPAGESQSAVELSLDAKKVIDVIAKADKNRLVTARQTMSSRFTKKFELDAVLKAIDERAAVLAG